MDKDKIYLAEIKEFCQKIINFSANMPYEDFAEDEKLQLAVIKLIENIGEASKRLSDSARKEYPRVEWKKVMGMRDNLVHDYMDVDLEIVYDVAVNEIPSLLDNLS